MVTTFFIQIFERNLFVKILCSSFDVFFERILFVFFERILFMEILLLVFIAKCLLSSCQHATFRHPFYRWVIFFLRSLRVIFLLYTNTPRIYSYDFACLIDLMPPSLFFFVILGIAFGKNASF